MLPKRLVKHKVFIDFLLSTKALQRKSVLRNMTNEQLQILSEIILNVYRGTFNVSMTYIKSLKKFKKYIHLLSDKKISRKIRRDTLVRFSNHIDLFLRPLNKFI